ncbi:cell adhesion molecule Dscam2-like isoform X2 [Plodia interpunctella]|uniref:cell adhesion molecule Dscam2-like isoform X2 n=1 Tax=Plodia interpunctella TaxID=58824 RepID=UPI002367A668|nr:cell adhesion molecule Dscam2-like isoform X2 [Plodia interpunctella]XP_053617550.1 cell adhesion molecule Dscam2-like isoform X2 [Plodia interpunctella]
MPASARLLPLLLLAVSSVGGGGGGSAPRLVVEPPALVRHSAAAGARLRCRAAGDPAPRLSWLGEDGAELTDTHHRRVFPNGTLEVLPSTAALSSSVVRCRAANAHGVALSREVMLEPVADVPWEAVVSAGTVSAGGVAAVSCRASAAGAAPLVRPAVWYRADQVLNVDPPAPESRYVVFGDTLLIRGVSPHDDGPYSCLARHSLTAVTKRSKPAVLTVSTGSSTSAPRLSAPAGELSVPAGAHVCLPCAAPDHPQPHYTWYRELHGRLSPVEPSPTVWEWGGGAALCFRRVRRQLAGAWLCKAYNVFGDATAQLRLNVEDVLTVTVSPTLVVADTGSTVRLNCSANDPTASLSWLHDGVATGAGSELILRGLARAQRGLYQCVARRQRESAQAAAEVRLGDSPPELHYTFIEQALRAGGSVSLRCAASGSPPPRIGWMLDSQPLDQYHRHRYFISDESSVNGDVVSILNISSASPEDGGRYTCRASNAKGHHDHSARLNIYGPPSIRALGPVRVVAGANATVFCPYAGYPISSISWWERGAGRAVEGTGRVSARGAELRLSPALAADAGHYACAVVAPDGAAARRDIEIQVRNPPKISPFMFSSELMEGSSVQVLCGVSSGDKPMYFSWLKDEAPLPPNLQIEEKSLNEFSLLMFSDLSAKHSGRYTCRVSNHAATVNYTATLSVKVAPSWISEPTDTAVMLGAPINLDCVAKGYPSPTVTWYRHLGEIASLNLENSNQWEVISGSEWGDTASGLRANNGTLRSITAMRIHQGSYRCVADNGVGPPLIKHVNLTIHEPAHFDESVGTNVSCVRGRSVSLVCHALGDSPLTLHWSHRGVRLDLNSYRWTVSEVRTADGLRSTLQLRAVERGDGGEYRCHAANQFGRSELLMFLHVEEPPEAPRALHLGGVSSRWVRVTWQAPALARTLWYSALVTPLHTLRTESSHATTFNLTIEPTTNERLDDSTLTTLAARVEALRPAAAYSLRLTAANHVGQSPTSDPLLFTTLDEAPSVSPQNVRVRPANSGELHISWSAPPQDSWNGELLGYVVTWRELSREGELANAGDDGMTRNGMAVAPGWGSTELTVAGLKVFSRYALTTRAYNRAGASPHSPAVYATTGDGVPEEPPNSVICEAVSTRSLRIRWSPPALLHTHALRGYDLHYAPILVSDGVTGGGTEWLTARTGASGEATLTGLRPATNYTVWVRARAGAGLGPPAAPVYCVTGEDVPGVVAAVRALASGPDAVRVSWLPPTPRAGRLTHYTLYTRELGKVGGEWSQRVEAGADINEDEVSRDVVGLRERTVYEFWVRAATSAGAGAPTRPVTAAPAQPLSARISSFSRIVHAFRGTRLRLRCSSVGAPPLRYHWSPLPIAHTITDSGDFIIHKVETSTAGNYTCSVRNGAGADAVVYHVLVRRPPAAPAPRLLRTDTNTLHLAWDPPEDGGASILGYTFWWRREGAPDSSPTGSTQVPAGDSTLTLRRLACGALYRVTMRAHNALGYSPMSPPLRARTDGDKVKPPLGKEFVWANSSTLRLNLLAWRGRCAAVSWSVSVRGERAGGGWQALVADGERAEANGLSSGTWYEVRVVAHGPAGDSPALYRAPTLTHTGERIGEPVLVPVEARSQISEGGGVGVGAVAWRAPLLPILIATALATLLASLAVGVVWARRRHRAWCLHRTCSPAPAPAHPQLYSTEPGKRNGKTLSPSDILINTDDLHDEISPYATFSMTGAASGCALHLHTFGRAESLDLAAAPPRPNLLAHSQEYGRARDSDSESSGSPCAACAASLYRLPAAHLSDTLPAVESSADDTSYSACGRGRVTSAQLELTERSKRAERDARGGRARRRRDHARHIAAPSGGSVRYFSTAALRSRDPL